MSEPLPKEVADGIYFRSFSICNLHVTMTSILSISRHTLDLPPSCIAFCPNKPAYFVVGTYYLHLNEHQDGPETSVADDEDERNSADVHVKPQKRSGALDLYSLQGDNV